MEIQPEIILAIIVALIVLAIAFFLLRRKKTPDLEQETLSKEEPFKKPGVLDNRLEVEAPVEIHDGMSLAEVKQAKAAKIVGNKGRRETAMEATAKSKEVHAFDEEEKIPPSLERKSPNINTIEISEGAIEEAFDASSASDVDEGWSDTLSETEVKSPIKSPIKTPGTPPKEPTQEMQKIEALAAKEGLNKKPTGLDIYSDIETSLEDGLQKTRTGFIKRLGKFFSGPELAEDLIYEIEEVLYTADIGPKAASHIIGVLETQMSDENEPQKVWAFVQEYIESILTKRQEPLDVDAENPFVIMMIGVNGVGKTTTIGKLASKYKKEGKKVILVAGDTFRAAAVEQLQVWGDRANIPVHAGESEADPSSVIYSGIERAKKEGFDIVICDTAGRLHTKAPLLDELGKMGRVAKKVIPNAPHETILVLDANTGQNAIQQALVFNKAVPITGIVLTKLDGTAKGGVILGICEELDAPIRFIGIGEGVNDLRAFNAVEFAEALFM